MIPRIMHYIWVGPDDPPMKWIGSWVDAHPGWQHKFWTNYDLDNVPWVNRHQMAHFAGLKRWAGVADLMRYEILFRYGGVVTAADSTCLRPIDELFDDDADLYAISTAGYGTHHPERNKGATTPLYAAVAHHEFTWTLIDKLSRAKMTKSPVRSTGNRLMQRMLKRYKPDIVVWPIHYFIPKHFNGWKYEGEDKPYAVHHWGSTRGTYHLGR